MDETLRFFRANEAWIYILFAFGAFLYVRRFVLAWRELRGSVFGLERENAQQKLNQAAGVLVLLLLLIIGEFIIVTIVAPANPAANTPVTPTLDLLASPTTTLPAPGSGAPEGGLGAAETPEPTGNPLAANCIPEVIDITSPEPGNVLTGEVVIMGSANIPNFGFYKVEVAPVQDDTWRTIQAGEELRIDDVLVPRWDTTSFVSGNYLLQLVLTDNNGAPSPPCQIPVQIFNP